MKAIQSLLLIYLIGLVVSQSDVSLDAIESQISCDSLKYNNIPQNETVVSRAPKTTHKFDNPALAYKVLEQLDVFKPVDEYHFRSHENAGSSYDIVYYGLIKDKNYCKKHRRYFVDNPEFIFNEINFIDENYPHNYFRSEIIGPIGNDIHEEIGFHMNKSDRSIPTINLKPEANSFFTSSAMNEKMHIGEHFSCLTQSSNHIPGHWSMCRKDSVAKSVNDYAKQYEDRPQCFSYDKFFPKTWLLYEKKDCKDFFAEFNSPTYQAQKEEHRIVYIRKVAAYSHRGDGVQPVNDDEEDELRATYNNGKLCGQVDDVIVVQKYIHKPLLIHGRKFDFRMFMLIASMNPLIAYYHDGGLRVSLAPYDISSDDKKVLLTNFALNHKIYKTAREDGFFQGKTEDELKMEQQWTFERLQKYLLEVGKINDTNWLDNYLRPEFKKAYIHLIRLSRHSYLNTSSSVFELYGADFMIDDDMTIWFIESNAGPALGGYTPETARILGKMLRDHIEIVMGLLRSRTKRIINYVNKIIKDGDVQEVDGGMVQIKDVVSKIHEFEDLTRNYFDEEFQPSPDNAFVKIIDERFDGAEAYLGYLKPECL